MKNIISGVLATFGMLLVLASPVTAQEPVLNDSVPQTYTVVKGDTLWDISERFLQNPWMWPEIWHVNAQIENPHLIYPGDVIRLISIEGRPRITIDSSPVRQNALEPRVRIVSQGDAIDTIPLERIAKFLSRSRVLDTRDLRVAPYVVMGRNEHLIVGEDDSVYGRDKRNQLGEIYSTYGIYREGQTFRDPKTNRKLGVEAINIGSARLISKEKQIAKLEVIRSSEEVRIGDRFLTDEERTIDTKFFPSPPATDIEGNIMAVEGGLTQVGRMDVVIINRGEEQGVAVGNVFAIFKKGNKVRDRVSGGVVRLPNEREGLIMVFRTFDKLSYALVLEATTGLTVGDIVKNP